MQTHDGKAQEFQGKHAQDVRRYLALMAGEAQKNEALNAEKKAKEKARRRAKRKKTGR